MSGNFPAADYPLGKLLAKELMEEAILNPEAAVRPVLSMKAAGVTTAWMM